MSDKKTLYVTQPSMPPLDEFIPSLEKIWTNKILTNGGPFHQELETELCRYLGVDYISLFANGTIALITALQSLRITGEVITTPYSFVATAHSLLWNGISPVFVDIDPITLNIDPEKIEAAITPRTTAILPVHCYGNPCNVQRIEKIANEYNLRVIYDAAHAFGVKDDQGSILRFGDLSVLSFHATKVFNTFEGGAIICNSLETKRRIDRLKNFGFVDELTVVAPGINGKMSEINAAFGMLQLKHYNTALKKRRDIDARYKIELSNITGIEIPKISDLNGHNFSYFPILVKSDCPITRDDLYEQLKQVGVYARRYFYPLISEFPMYRSLPSAKKEHLGTATEISKAVLCLPIYPDLSESDQMRVIDTIKSVVSLNYLK